MNHPLPKISLFVTCLVDQIMPEVGVSTVKLLRRAGYEVRFPPTRPAADSRFLTAAFRTRPAV
jgi:L-lactate dehydrogenase complex protein LldE